MELVAKGDRRIFVMCQFSMLITFVIKVLGYTQVPGIKSYLQKAPGPKA